jgi:predicted phosphate transport protein (TIGR00153 family)
MATRNPLGNLFGRSPIGPIQEHMQIAEEAAQFLPQLIQASIDDDWERAAHIHAEIVSAEREADKLKRSVRRHLPKSLFLPVPRSDLLELVALQDAVANTAKDIGVLMIGRKMRFPEKIEKYVIEFTAICVATVNQALLAIQELDELLEVGFTGREVKRVEAMLKELDKLEGRTDKLAVNLRGRLFKLETDLPPVDVMFYYRVLALLSGIADAAERVGDRLQIVMAK